MADIAEKPETSGDEADAEENDVDDDVYNVATQAFNVSKYVVANRSDEATYKLK